MRIIAISAITIMSLCLADCDNPASSGDDFQVSTTHDEFDGDVTVAQKEFVNSEGTSAQVKLICSADEKTNAVEAFADLGSAFATAMLGAATGAKPGCPDNLECGVVAEIAFFSDEGKPAKLVTSNLSNEGQPQLVYYEEKNGENAPFQGLTTLERNGSSYYYNAIKIPVPTRGADITKWLYRFHVQQHDQPIDVVMNYSAPNLSEFVQACNHKLPAKKVTPSASAPPPPALDATNSEQNTSTNSPSPVIAPDGDELQTAFTAAFGTASTARQNDVMLTFKPSQLVPISDNIFALLSEGADASGDACDGCYGQLQVTYLIKSGDGFALASPPVRKAIDGNAWGSPPEWHLASGFGSPTILTMQDVERTTCSVGVYHLTPTGIVLDMDAERSAKANSKKYSDCDLVQAADFRN
ncbi:MAG TPA: hypothetical protein VJ476_01610 [Rhizomicrobium sp.]|nr:hypothetical protein [Rhizomicrobium sp.]